MNTAGRILCTYDRLISLGRGNDVSMVNAWADVFQLPRDSAYLEDEVVTCLQATRSEIELLRTKLLAIGVTEELLQPGLTRLRNITSAANLNAGWNSLREEIARPENRLPFVWANWVLKNESEVDMPPEELAALVQELNSLEKSSQEAGMSPYLRDFVQRQIDAIRLALRVYPVQGVKPIEDALQKVAGAYTLEKANVEAEHSKASEPAKSVVSRMGGIIEKTAKYADSLDKIRKSGEGFWTLAESVIPVIQNFTKSM